MSDTLLAQRIRKYVYNDWRDLDEAKQDHWLVQYEYYNYYCDWDDPDWCTSEDAQILGTGLMKMGSRLTLGRLETIPSRTMLTKALLNYFTLEKDPSLFLFTVRNGQLTTIIKHCCQDNECKTIFASALFKLKDNNKRQLIANALNELEVNNGKE